MDKYIKKNNDYSMGNYARHNVVIDSGNGSICVDTEGKEYVDFSSGIGVNCLGFCDSEWMMAITEQLNKIQHTSNIVHNKPSADLSEKLCELSGYNKVFLSNSGAEANETAIKLARKYSFDKYGKGRSDILCLINSFHGRTLAALSATGQDGYHNFFFPFVEGFKFAKANDIESIKENIDGCCAVLLEVIQGEGGVLCLEKEFVQKISQICEENDILLICDEVQTGIGRTGKLLAMEHFCVRANITTLAKGLGAGLPIGAVLADKKCENVLTFGTHGSTFGGNPIVCAGALTVLDKIVNAEFLQGVEKKGQYIVDELLKLEQVKSITGMGLMLGIETQNDNAKDLVAECLNLGLIVLMAKNKIRVLPPLNISQEMLERGLDILKTVLS